MNAASEDIKDILEAESSLGLVYATDLFIGREPPKPKNCVTIYDAPGAPPLLTLEEEGEAYDYASVQVRVRNTKYSTGWELAKNIQNTLHGRANETWNDTLYTVIYCTSGPALLEWDQNDMVIFVINFNIQRR